MAQASTATVATWPKVGEPERADLLRAPLAQRSGGCTTNCTTTRMKSAHFSASGRRVFTLRRQQRCIKGRSHNAGVAGSSPAPAIRQGTRRRWLACLVRFRTVRCVRSLEGSLGGNRREARWSRVWNSWSDIHGSSSGIHVSWRSVTTRIPRTFARRADRRAANAETPPPTGGSPRVSSSRATLLSFADQPRQRHA